MAVLALTAQGRLQYDHFLFANVGDDSENPDTLTYFEQIAMPYAEQHGIELIELQRTWRDGRQTTVYEDVMSDNRSIAIPAYLGSGSPSNRNCTGRWKIDVIARWQRQHGATVEHPAVCGLGISMDEIGRMRTDSGIKHQVLEYPLIDLRLNRRDCMRIIEDAGLPVPAKSSCYFCPFHRHAEWQEMRRTKPELFEKAVALEQRINEKRSALGLDDMYLHASLNPLDQAVGLQYTLFEDDACESGHCMT